MTGSATTHIRLNTGALAAIEKRTLIWLAHRLPHWLNSDHLTLLALAAMAATGAAFWAARAWPLALTLVPVCLAVNWFGDSLDGTLARVRQHERPRYGFYVDHVLDITGACFLFGGMALSGFMSPVVGLALLAAYLLVSAEVFLATGVNGTFRMSFMNVGPTELRILLSAGALVLLVRPVVSPFGFGPYLLFDVGGLVAIAGLAVAFLTSTTRTTMALYRAEPVRKASTVASLVAGVVLLVPAGSSAATLEPHTAKAWDAYVAATEARIARELAAPQGFLVSDFTPDQLRARQRVLAGEVVAGKMTTAGATGTAIDVPDGLVTHWRGSVFVRGVTLDMLLHRLQHPNERGPHQEDVVALRVLARQPDHLKLFIRMTRSKIVTVTYDTEHTIDYQRPRPTRAASRSIATKIVELEHPGAGSERAKGPGEDRGFLWRLNWYWRYEQVPGGVIVELESLTLSRSVPLGLGAVVQPLIDRIARESIGRTLENLRQTYAPAAAAKPRAA